jgi:hypothetical protein
MIPMLASMPGPSWPAELIFTIKQAANGRGSNGKRSTKSTNVEHSRLLLGSWSVYGMSTTSFVLGNTLMLQLII